MASQVPQPNPPQLNFPAMLTWGVFQANEQHLPRSYRQLFYWPSLSNNIDWQLPALFREADREDNTTGQVQRAFMWTRLLINAEMRVHTSLRRMADTRNPLLINSSNPPPPAVFRGDPQGDMAHLHRHLRVIIESVFQESLFDIKDPLLFPDTDATYIENVVVVAPRYKLLVHRIQYDPIYMQGLEARRLQLQDGGLRGEFLWIEDFYQSILMGLDHFGAAWNWARYTGQSLEDGMQAALENVPEMTRLLAILLEREEMFRIDLTSEHIFGCLYDKRISPLRPTQLSQLYDIYLSDEGPVFNPVPQQGDHDYNHIYGREMNYLYKELRDYQMAMYDIFDFRQLVEWGYRPVFKQIYTVLPDELKISAQTVREFHRWADSGHLARNFFSVRPVVSTHFADETCIVCMENLVPVQGAPEGVMVLELHCSHRFHPECILPHFDGFNKWTNRCPLCRHAAGALRDMVAPIRAAVTDTDFEAGDGASQTHDWWRATIQQYVMTPQQTFWDSNYGPHYHEAWWSERIYNYRALKRDRRVARRRPNAWFYGA